MDNNLIKDLLYNLEFLIKDDEKINFKLYPLQEKLNFKKGQLIYEQEKLKSAQKRKNEADIIRRTKSMNAVNNAVNNISLDYIKYNDLKQLSLQKIKRVQSEIEEIKKNSKN